MKTERMVLLVTPEEKARVSVEAAKLGVSASEYVRKAANALDADDLRAIAEFKDLLPELGAALDRIEANVAGMLARGDEHRQVMAHQRSEAYRAQVREDVLADPSIDWDRVRALFGGRSGEEAA